MGNSLLVKDCLQSHARSGGVMEEDLVSHVRLLMLGRDSQIDSPLVCSKARGKENGNYTKQFY